VSATNSYGESALSESGNGATIVLVPSAPVNLANNLAVTTKSVIGITWKNGASTGGSPLIDYQVLYDKGNGDWVVLAASVSTTSYQTIVTLTPGQTYSFKVQSRNSVGLSLESAVLSVLAAQPPDQPSAPVTSFSGTSVTVTWTAPDNAGSVITSY
jgi:hypothetical protein